MLYCTINYDDNSTDKISQTGGGDLLHIYTWYPTSPSQNLMALDSNTIITY